MSSAQRCAFASSNENSQFFLSRLNYIYYYWLWWLLIVNVWLSLIYIVIHKQRGSLNLILLSFDWDINDIGNYLLYYFPLQLSLIWFCSRYLYSASSTLRFFEFAVMMEPLIAQIFSQSLAQFRWEEERIPNLIADCLRTKSEVNMRRKTIVWRNFLFLAEISEAVKRTSGN